MNSNLPPERAEYTPEQRRLLARAYRLILRWRRDNTPRKPASDRSTDVAHMPSSATRQAKTEADRND